jgi:hypothetical protein
MIESLEFKTLWSNHNVAYEEHFIKELSVEPFGKLLFDFTSFDVSSNPQIKIAIHTPDDDETIRKLTEIL